MAEMSPNPPNSNPADSNASVARREADAEPSVNREPPIRVLIVDDHVPVRRGIRLLLSSDPSLSICGEAGDGIEAVEKAATLRPDVILMDITMPRMDGLKATRAIKQAVPATRVILVSHNDPGIVQQHATEVNADAVVAKSELSQQLISAIGNLFGKTTAEPETDRRRIPQCEPRGQG